MPMSAQISRMPCRGSCFSARAAVCFFWSTPSGRPPLLAIFAQRTEKRWRRLCPLILGHLTCARRYLFCRTPARWFWQRYGRNEGGPSALLEAKVWPCAERRRSTRRLDRGTGLAAGATRVRVVACRTSTFSVRWVKIAKFDLLRQRTLDNALLTASIKPAGNPTIH